MRRVRGVAAAVGALLVTSAGCGQMFAEPSPLPTVRNFLVAWQNGNYPGAAKQTNGDRKMVAGALEALPGQLDLASLHLALGHVRKRTATTPRRSSRSRIDLGDNGPPWDYGSQMRLHRSNGRWKVVWSPSIIHPKLGKGQRLAVVTETPQRAPSRTQGPAADQEDQGGDLRRPPRPAAQAGRHARPALQDHPPGQGPGARPGALGAAAGVPPAGDAPAAGARPPRRPSCCRCPGVQARARYLRSRSAGAGRRRRRARPGHRRTASSRSARRTSRATRSAISGLQVLDQRRLAGTPTVKVVAQDPSGAGSQVLYELPGTHEPAGPYDDRPACPERRRRTRCRALHGAGVAGRGAPGDRRDPGRRQPPDGRQEPGLRGPLPARHDLQHDHDPGAAGLPPKLGATVDRARRRTKVGDEVFHNTAVARQDVPSNFARSCSTAFASLYRSLAYQDRAGRARRLRHRRPVDPAAAVLLRLGPAAGQ